MKVRRGKKGGTKGCRRGWGGKGEIRKERGERG